MNINKLIWDFILQEKGYMIAYICFLMAFPITSVWLPSYYGQILSEIKDGKPPRFKMMVILILLVTVMYAILGKLDSSFIPKLQAYVRVHVVKVILDKYENNFEEQELGTLISKIVKLPIVVRELVRQFRNYVAPLVMVFIGVIIRFLMINAKIGFNCVSFYDTSSLCYI